MPNCIIQSLPWLVIFHLVIKVFQNKYQSYSFPQVKVMSSDFLINVQKLNRDYKLMMLKLEQQKSYISKNRPK